MCHVCCKELKDWCRAFSSTERCFTLLEAILLVLLVVLMVFLVLHLLVCPTYNDSINVKPTVDNSKPWLPDNISDNNFSRTEPTSMSVATPDIDCTWTPSHKTVAFTHYYENGATNARELTTLIDLDSLNNSETHSNKWPLAAEYEGLESIFQDLEGDIQNEFVMALARFRPPRGVEFGCVVTVVSPRWALTAASCPAALEAKHSPDSFVIVDEYGTSKGNVHSILEVQTHPFYGAGVNASYDLAAVRSASALRAPAAELPALLERLLVTAGERFYILEFDFVNKETRRRVRGPRRVRVYTLSAACCGRRARVARHLLPAGDARSAPAPPPLPPPPPLCAGPAAAPPRRACHTPRSGTPLLRGATLFGVMSARLAAAAAAASAAAAAACRPQRYVDVAAPPVRTWVDDLVDEE